MVRRVGFWTAIATVTAATQAWAAERSLGAQDGGYLLLALFALIPLRIAVRIIPEWIRSFGEGTEGEREAAPVRAESD